MKKTDVSYQIHVHVIVNKSNFKNTVGLFPVQTYKLHVHH